jgi:hypothetical protein
MKLSTDHADILAFQCLAIRTAEITCRRRGDLQSMQWLVDLTMETLADNEFELAEMRAKVRARMEALSAGKARGAA